MKSYLKLTGLIAIFWFIFFYLQHIIFLAFSYNQWREVQFVHVLASFRYAFVMNIAAIAYLIILPFLVINLLVLIRQEKLVRHFVLIYMMAALIINITLCKVDIGLVHAWSSKMNSKALFYLLFPGTAVATIEGTYNIVLAFLWLTEIVAGIWLIRKIFGKISINRAGHWLYWTLSFFILAAVIVSGLRGGFQDRPISRSWVYYSKYSVLNNAAMNSFWNLLDVLFYYESKENPYGFFDDTTAGQLVSGLFHDPGIGGNSILKVEKPNIVLVLLEGWSADAVGCLGGEPGITPGFDSLAEKGILFTGFYSSGFRTEQGLVAILSGFPAQPQSTIIREFGKFEHLENLVKTLTMLNYQSSYYYSGDLDFANTGIYLKMSGFDIIYGERNFSAKRRTRWGAYDEELFDFHLNDTLSRRSPFFSILMTSTSHEPFNADVFPVRKPVDEPSRYLNTIHYTDSCLSDYLIKASSSSWFRNTLFIITSDHGHYNPNNRSYNSPERHQIPLLFYGGALKEDFRGKQYSVTGYHPDIAVTICRQLRADHTGFDWGNDLFDPQGSHIAFYTFDNGFGMICDSCSVIYDHNLKEPLPGRGAGQCQEDLLRDGKALLQSVVQRYLDLDQ